MDKIYEYTFTKTDYDSLQQSILTKDIFGSSSFKGEEKIVIYRDKIEYVRSNKTIKSYLFKSLEGFTVENFIGSVSNFKFIVLVKKYSELTFYEKWILPVLINPNKDSNGFDPTTGDLLNIKQNIALKILNSKVNEFVENLSLVLPQITRSESEISRKSSSKGFWFWVLLILLMLIISIL